MPKAAPEQSVENFHVRPLTEADIDVIIRAAGGIRAHPDADRRSKPGADYVLAEALIEVKLLDDEGLAKPQRQAKLAALFQEYESGRPVIVLDRSKLPAHAQRDYDRILEGPVKSAVSKAKRQLKQSRVEHHSASTCVLLMINNGYTALNHDALLQIVAQRARNDTAEIDGVVVAGCYFHSDGFDNYFLWPIDYLPINLRRPFTSYENLCKAWTEHADQFMTRVVLGQMPPTKGPVVDVQFDVDGVTYIRPAPSVGKESDFFGKGRPRNNSSGLIHCPSVAMTFPDMTADEWKLFREALPDTDSLFDEYQKWRADRAAAAAAGTPLRPSVPITITSNGWEEWCNDQQIAKSISSIRRYANDIAETKIRAVMAAARERLPSSILLSRYVLVVTEEIGQDRANDVSHIAVIRESPSSDTEVRELVADARIFHEYALALACSYAVAEGIECVLWQKDLRYAWV